MYDEAKEVVEDLTTPKKIMQLPFPIRELKTLILTKKDHYTILRDDGKIYSIRYDDGLVREATDYALELVNADGGSNKVTKIK
jgi:hypothetical protein